MQVYERLMFYATLLYERALRHFEQGNLRRAESTASAAAGAAGFVEGDDESPGRLRARATELIKAVQDLLAEIYKNETDRPDRESMSGARKRPSLAEREARSFVAELRDVMREVRG